MQAKRRTHACQAARAAAAGAAATVQEAPAAEAKELRTGVAAPHTAHRAPADVVYDAIVIGSGIGGLTTATQLAARGARVLVLEKCAVILPDATAFCSIVACMARACLRRVPRPSPCSARPRAGQSGQGSGSSKQHALHASCRYVIPGGSAGHFHRQGYTFDVGSSMMFGLGQAGTTNLITRALAAVGKRLDTVPDPTQIHYHLPRSEAHPEVGSPARPIRLGCPGQRSHALRQALKRAATCELTLALAASLQPGVCITDAATTSPYRGASVLPGRCLLLSTGRSCTGG